MGYFKKDLRKVIIMSAVVLVLLAGLAIWNNQTGALDSFAERIF